MSRSANFSGAEASASISAASPSKTRARPVNRPSCMSPSTPASVITAPTSGARVPVRLERRRQRVDLLAVRRGRGQPGDLPGQGLAGAGDAVTVEHPGIEQLADDHRQAALGVDVDHRVTAERTGVNQYRQGPRGLIEVLLADHLVPEVA